MEHELKAFTIDATKVDLKKLDKGELSLVFATMGVWDKDGDFAEPGFYGAQDVQFIPTHDWSHVWMGKGVTREEGNEVIADIKVNLEIQAARDWLSAIKFDLGNGKPIGEYSYGFKVLEGGSEMGERLGRRGRILRAREDGTPGAKIWEVSPVLVGAGEKTRTLSAKGKKFCDEADAVLAAAEDLVARGKSLADLRAKEGRDVSTANKERLAGIADSLTKAASGLLSLVAPVAVEAASETEAKRELVRMMKIRAGLK